MRKPVDELIIVDTKDGDFLGNIYAFSTTGLKDGQGPIIKCDKEGGRFLQVVQPSAEFGEIVLFK